MLRTILVCCVAVMAMAAVAARGQEAASQPAATQPAGETIAVGETDALKAAVGKAVTVHGTVGRIGWSPNGSILFVNFEGVDRDGFTAIVRKEHKDALAAFGEDGAELSGKTINLTGKIILYKNQRTGVEKPEIEISKAEQIKLAPAAAAPAPAGEADQYK